MNNVTGLSARAVLIVDDDQGTVTTFAHALRASGHRVLTAASGEDAIRQADRATTDLVLCDLNLPDMSGIDVCRTLRQAGVRAPFVIITGFATTSAAFEAGRLGATRFLEKPVDVDELVTFVERQLGECPSRSAPLGYEVHMARLAQVIESHYTDPELSVGSVARDVGLSKKHVCRVFKFQHKTTFAEFLRQKRVREARVLLECSSWTVKEIAFRVGFR